jgi:hypothetical protein
MRTTASIALIGLAALAASATMAESGRRSVTTMSSDEGRISVRQNNEPMVEGSGRIVRRPRAAAAFDSVEVNGPAHLEVAVGGRPSIEVQIDDNLVGNIVTETRGGALSIRTTGSFRTRTAPVVRVTAPTLARLQSIGSGNVRITGQRGDRLELDMKGSGNLIVDGQSRAVIASLYGSGNADLTRLAAADLSVNLYGSGNARVHAERDLSAAVYGSGSIGFSGQPARLRQSVHGTGRITRIGR